MRNSDRIDAAFHTFNPWWGCTKVSGGCKFCYAEALAQRYGHDLWGPGRPRRTISDSRWNEPRRWNDHALRTGVRVRVFCASMADVFDDAAPEGQLDRLWRLIRETPSLDWMLLTKRPERIAIRLPQDWGAGYANAWLGTTVEDSRVTGRIDVLREIPAFLRFLSLEPLIGPLPNLNLEGIAWMFVGGESGPGARPIQEEWVLDILRQCREQDVAFLFKQWGGVDKRQTGRLLRGRIYDEMPVLAEPKVISASAPEQLSLIP